MVAFYLQEMSTFSFTLCGAKSRLWPAPQIRKREKNCDTMLHVWACLDNTLENVRKLIAQMFHAARNICAINFHTFSYTEERICQRI